MIVKDVIHERSKGRTLDPLVTRYCTKGSGCTNTGYGSSFFVNIQSQFPHVVIWRWYWFSFFFVNAITLLLWLRRRRRRGYLPINSSNGRTTDLIIIFIVVTVFMYIFVCLLMKSWFCREIYIYIYTYTGSIQIKSQIIDGIRDSMSYRVRHICSKERKWNKLTGMSKILYCHAFRDWIMREKLNNDIIKVTHTCKRIQWKTWSGTGSKTTSFSYQNSEYKNYRPQVGVYFGWWWWWWCLLSKTAHIIATFISRWMHFLPSF